MFVVVEHFLTNLDHFVAHVLNFRHSLHKERSQVIMLEKKKMHNHVTFLFDSKTASPAGRDLQQHELPRTCREERCECTIQINHWVLVLGSLGQILDSLKG